MKTFRLIGMALLAIVMSFASCSSDDDEGNGGNGGNGQKKLVRMVKNDDEYIFDFSYDNNGRLVSVKYKEGDYVAITTISWDGNTITTREGNSTVTFTLSNNLVTKWIDKWKNSPEREYSLSYNSSNQLTELTETYESGHYDTYIFEWQNGKVSKFTDYNGIVYEYTYYDNINYKGYAPVINVDRIWGLFENDEFFYAHPELIGLRNLGLPKTIVNTDTGKTISIAYEFYEDGYVKTRTMSSSDSDYPVVYTYTWE